MRLLPILSLIVLLPLAGAIAIALLPNDRTTWPRWVAAAVSASVLALATYAMVTFRPAGGLQFVEKFDWVPAANIQYYMGLDGLSVLLVALSALLSLLAVIASWKMDKRPKFYFAMLLVLATGTNGVFSALDFILFYVFWELVLVPMYFLIAVWGGPRREYAAIKFFLYTLLGSVFMLVGILAIYLHPQGGTFDMIALVDRGFPANFQWWVFAAFFLGFAVKVPVWPLHTWLPDAHVEAPTAASVLLAGILLKMGTYGFLRVSLPILPEAWKSWSWFIALLAVISIVYGAAVAFAQTDLKKLVAYSSVSHMGFAMLGIAAGTAVGLDGAQAVNISHGFLSAMLFLCVGIVYERAHTRQIAEISGVAGQMPVYAGMFAFASFASLGLPGLSGFVGEFLALLGSWGSTLSYWYTIAAAIGVLVGAAYMLWMIQRVILGEPSHSIADAPDISVREASTLVPLAVLSLVMGVWWASTLQFFEPYSEALAKVLGG
ncbi:MAG: NADH-quinone oxidoreductase subunit M [Coriobacteriales bacterium]|nr:NADH-quinone oxidoreductase subunit M [Coriobacteriales bacterium]